MLPRPCTLLLDQVRIGLVKIFSKSESFGFRSKILKAGEATRFQVAVDRPEMRRVSGTGFAACVMVISGVKRTLALLGIIPAQSADRVNLQRVAIVNLRCPCWWSGIGCRGAIMIGQYHSFRDAYKQRLNQVIFTRFAPVDDNDGGGFTIYKAGEEGKIAVVSADDGVEHFTMCRVMLVWDGLDEVMVVSPLGFGLNNQPLLPGEGGGDTGKPDACRGVSPVFVRSRRPVAE